MTLISFILSFFILSAEAQIVSKEEASLYNQVVTLYNKKKYEESLALLESNRNAGTSSGRWNYFYALNKLRLEDYDEAIANLNTYIDKNTIAKSSRASYYLGVAYFYKGEYEKAVNSLQLSLDTSRDPKLDSVTDAFLEKTIRYYDYYQSHKKASLLMMLGYGFKSNAIDVSQDLSEENLNGHAVNYGFALSYRAIDKINFVFEPTLNFIDRYSLDHSFSESGLIQSNDTMQFLFSLPIIFKNKAENILYSASVNSYASYLPIASTSRELYLTSQFLNGKISYDISSQYLLESGLVLASDATKAYADTDNDGTGLRYVLDFSLSRYFEHTKVEVLSVGGVLTQKAAKGNDVFYESSALSAAYTLPSDSQWRLSATGGVDYIVFPKKAVKRSDLKSSIGFTATQLFANSSLNYGLGYVLNNSNEELYKYNDIQASIVYLYKLGF